MPSSETLKAIHSRKPTGPSKWVKLWAVGIVVAAGLILFFVFRISSGATFSETAAIEGAIKRQGGSATEARYFGEGRASMTPPVSSIQKKEVVVTSPLREMSSESLTRDQLLAEVHRLLSENAALSQQKEQLYKKAAALDRQHQPENFYRPDSEQLRAWAEDGELHLHFPPTLARDSSFDPRLRDELGMQPNEESAVRDIFTRSNQRIDDGLLALYQEMGGNPDFGRTLHATALINEIRSKSFPGDSDDLARRAARERAGLEAVGDPNAGPVMLRVYRLIWREEDRLLNELDAVLGPARAEQFMNHEKTSHIAWMNRARGLSPR